MSKGMWTKQFTSSGKAFYYNSTQNLSVWQPPSDSVIHEASHAGKQDDYVAGAQHPAYALKQSSCDLNPRHTGGSGQDPQISLVDERL